MSKFDEMLYRCDIRKTGEIYSNGKLLKGHKHKDGSVRVSGIPVHKLVATKYIPNPDSATTIRHKDGNKLNNAVENLEWVKPRKLNYDDYFVTRDGKTVYNKKTGKELKQSTQSNGYYKASRLYVHRLVALQYVPNPDPEHLIVVNHKDGNKSNNHADNLEWVDYSGNTKHSFKNGLQTANKGVNSTHTKLTIEDLQDIINRYGNNEMVKDIAKHYNLGSMEIIRIVRKERFASESHRLDYSPIKKRKKKASRILEDYGIDNLVQLYKDCKGNYSKMSRKLNVSRITIKNYLQSS